MIQKQLPRKLMSLLTGLLFAAYAAYNVFILFRDRRSLPLEGLIISALVALLFAIFAGFAFTACMNITNMVFMMLRSIMFKIALLMVFLLKLRMIGSVIAYVDVSSLPTVLYGISYAATQLGLLILFVYYTFVVQQLPVYPKVGMILSLLAALLFTGSLVLEIILYARFQIILEATPLRTMVMRPVFYLGFIGLSVYFLLPAPAPEVD